MNYMQNKTPEERKAIAAKRVATRQANIAKRIAEEEARQKAEEEEARQKAAEEAQKAAEEAQKAAEEAQKEAQPETQTPPKAQTQIVKQAPLKIPEEASPQLEATFKFLNLFHS